MHIDELDTPALWADLDVVERNLSRMGEYCKAHGLALRPHIKTHKIPELAWRQIESGAVGITCAKVTEAAVMAAAGLEDILLAYPLWGPHKWRNLLALTRRARVSVATDSPEHAQATADALGDSRREISYLVEVDSGGRRTGLQLDDSLAGKVARIAESGVPVRGIMLYPGHVRKVTDEALRKLSAQIGIAREAFGQAGVDVEVVSGGSTPTALRSHEIEGLTEIRPGTYIFNDLNYHSLGACELADCALRVRCRVVSASVPDTAIIDGGSKTFSDAAGIAGRGFGMIEQHPEAECEKMNEEHGYVRTGQSEWNPSSGELVDVYPNHVCTTVNMHRVLHLVRGGEVEEILPIAAAGKIH
ncbi:MAG: D-TA family PLP-dependent enzyme [Candidatus Glassbacteria bacterium]|nr:D-TA family PLP-dependent enzyme [Candidatus Glassbacteria bacterium]